MTTNSWIEIGLFLAVLIGLTKPLGWFMARVYTNRPCGLDKVLGPIERLIYRVCGVKPESEMTWKEYATGVLAFSVVSTLAVYGLQRLQGILPLNPQGLAAVPPDLSLNTAVSFVSNTNWQAYSGESMMSNLTQMLGLGVQNFVSAAVGMAVLVAFLRGITRRQVETIGNFW